MILFILFLVFTTVLTQDPTCPPPQDCRLPCPLGTCCICENPCPATCNDTNPTPCPTLQCNPGCYKFCPKGQVFNQIGGYCIPQNICQPNEADECCTRPNEVYYECRQCTGTCRVLKPNCTLEACGIPAGCDCEEGLVRDEKTGKCVNPDSPSCKEQRGTQCGPNEVLAACGSAICQENRCDNSTIACPQLCAEPPLGFCVCKEGFYRDTQTGQCVDPESPQCKRQQCNDDTEQYYHCSTKLCQRNCTTPNPGCPKQSIEICLQPGNCDCKPDLVRDTNTGKCISPQLCPPVCNGTNEIYYECRSCRNSCTRPDIVCPAVCITPGNCDCINGYLRDADSGECIDENSDACKRQYCKDGEQYYRCRDKICLRNCSNPKPICIRQSKQSNICLGACECKPGLVRDTNTGKCVSPELCSPVCKADEQYYECSTANCQRTCEDPNPICINVCITPGNCDCKVGLVRDTKTGKCVKPEMCSNPVCKGKYEQFYECQSCPRTCVRPQNFCPAVCITPGNCDCIPEKVRDTKTGKCVNPDNKSCLCQRNNTIPIVCQNKGEIYWECGTKFCQRTCAQPVQKCPFTCEIPGNCDCSPDLLRDEVSGQCVDPNEQSCRDQRNGSFFCAKPDEQFYPCATKTCFPSCKDPNPICPEICFIPGNCHCKEGLVRDTETGNCVTPDDPSCIAQRTPVCNITGEQYYFCNTAGCERTCQQPVVACPRRAIEICIQPGNCDCKPELVRDTTTNQCVDMDSPTCKSQRCRSDQKYYPCSTLDCFPTCDNSNPICSGICKLPGNCDCKPGLVRTESGDCIKPESCPTLECDDNEQYYNCSTANCQRTCKEPNPICTEECITPGNCDCKIGLVRDTKNGQCCHPNKKSCRKQRIKH